ncbi:LysM peptidoglycan-binding domain-containing protein [Microbacterium sp. zg-Y818]|uniref:muramidase family protein n=1 Tax=unclassified Microbacterium TaxID=2609290 RepID=UPI00214BA038|nr:MULTISPECIES: LysM peptidoglycan-binding domain-containing protein [unclassified Microbacterium]MCR2800623.1 LysM peptidoglycan-binding domain-containing protein [Microbacterium sp. zg.Y818]WIM23349.1 LysM peptidoglycan-binding domain-containing protein [Microbacterium sp. zg-Y818]
MRRHRALAPAPAAAPRLSSPLVSTTAAAVRRNWPAAAAGSLALLLTSGQAAHAVTPHPVLRDATVAPASAGSKSLPVGRALPATSSAPTTHVVEPGDTISSIAAAHGLRVADVLALNSLTWSSVIMPGQTIQLAAPAAAPVAPAAPPAGTYSVVAGDTMSAIASRHGVPTDALLAANGMDRSSVIYPGQTLALPGAGMQPAASVAPAAAPPTPAAPVAASHEITAGDTMTGIASRYGVSLDALLSANGMDRSSIIYPGQTVKIPAASVAGLDAEQAANARTIISVGRELGVPDRGIAIALATGMVESWLRNLDWGDRDSLGVFQQRPSQGWGSPEQVRDVERAARVFFGGPSDPNGADSRGLLDTPGWEALAFTDAAQAVQVSAYPHRYGDWEEKAYAWLAALG